MFLRYLFEIVNHHLVHIVGSVPDHRGNIVDLVAFRYRTPGMGAAATGERTPRHHRHFPILAKRHNLPFFLTINKVVLGLKGNELRPAVLLGNVLHPFQLPGENRRCTDITRLAALHHIM